MSHVNASYKSELEWLSEIVASTPKRIESGLRDCKEGFHCIVRSNILSMVTPFVGPDESIYGFMNDYKHFLNSQIELLVAKEELKVGDTGNNSLKCDNFKSKVNNSCRKNFILTNLVSAVLAATSSHNEFVLACFKTVKKRFYVTELDVNIQQFVMQVAAHLNFADMYISPDMDDVRAIIDLIVQIYEEDNPDEISIKMGSLAKIYIDTFEFRKIRSNIN